MTLVEMLVVLGGVFDGRLEELEDELEVLLKVEEVMEELWRCRSCR